MSTALVVSMADNAEFKMGPTVTEREFLSALFACTEREFTLMVPSEVAHVITMYVGSQNTIISIRPRVCKASNIDIVYGSTTKKSSGGAWGTVLFAEEKPSQSSRRMKYEVAFRINKMREAFYIGYVFGTIEYYDFQRSLGSGTNGKISVGIKIEGDRIYLYDENSTYKMLRGESEDGPSTFPEQGQIWKINWDLIEHEIRISLRNEEDTKWIQMVHHAIKKKYGDVIPGISLWDEGDSLTLQTELTTVRAE